MASNLNLTFGAAYVGVILSAFVYGIATLQMYVYWLEPQHDSALQRLYIISLWLLDTFKLACICHMEYYYGISNHGNPASLTTSIWSLRMQLAVTPIITVMVQGYFAKRAWYFTKQVKSRLNSPRVTQATGLVIGILSIAQLGFGLAYFASTWRYPKFADGKHCRWMAIAWLGSAALCDTLIVYMLSAALIAQRTGFKRTDALINKILLYTINTGSFTSVVAIIALILCWSMQNFVYLGPTFMLGTLYIILNDFQTLLANLNARKSDGSKSIYFDDSYDSDHTTRGGVMGPETVRSRVNIGPRVEIYRGTTEHGVRISSDQFVSRFSGTHSRRDLTSQTGAVPRSSRRTLDTTDSDPEGLDVTDLKPECIHRTDV